MVTTIAVIGAGTMGNGIAHVFAQNGYKVHLVDISQESLDKGTLTIANNLDRMLLKNVITKNEKIKTLENISTYTSLKEGVNGAGLVIEAATENVELKLSIFKELDVHCHKNTILATNTSSISITQIAAVTQRPDKVIGMHFMNPVPIMKLVEIIRGYNTSDSVTKTVMDISQKLGKIATEVNDYPGFVANRILI